MKKKVFTLRWQLLVFILTATIIPIFIISIFSSRRILSYLIQEKQIFYSELLGQLAGSFDHEFDRYTMTLTDIISMDNFIKIVEHPPFRSAMDESNFLETITLEKGENPKGSCIRKTVLSRINGHLLIIELDRKSIMDKTDFKIYDFSSSGKYHINIEKLINDPLMQELRSDPDLKITFGKLQINTITAQNIDEHSVFIYPYYHDINKPFTKILMVMTNNDFIPDFYNNINQLHLGTIYVLDRNNQILTANHPGMDDCYDFDQEANNYIKDEKRTNKSDNPMSFNEYKRLNTDPLILDHPGVRKIINKLNTTIKHDKYKESEFSDIINYNGQKYLAIFQRGKSSNCKFIYFHPIVNIYKPICRVIIFVFIITIILIAIVTLLSLMLSRSITMPIKVLVDASRKIKTGQYDIDIKLSTKNELTDLAQSLNTMAREIQNKTEKLEDANFKLTRLDKIKSMFLHTISDQLRTPLNLIAGFNEILAREHYTSLLNSADTASDILEILPDDGKGFAYLQSFLSWFTNEVVDKDKTFFDMFTHTVEQNIKDYPADVKQNIQTMLVDLVKLHDSSLETTEDAYRVIRNNIKCLVSIIESASDVSRIDASTSLVKRNMIDFHDFIGRLKKEVELNCFHYNKREEIQFSIELDDRIPDSILIDEMKTLTVMQNILSNAVKYTDNGLIKLKVTYSKKEEGSNFISFSVTDTGRGIKKEDFDLIFTEFAKPDYTTVVDGAGIGLALCKKIVELMNGSIKVESEFGKGSTFSVILPVM